MTSCAASNKTDAEMAQKVVEFERKKIIDYRVRLPSPSLPFAFRTRANLVWLCGDVSPKS